MTKKFYLKITNPTISTYHIVLELMKEFSLEFEEFWQNKKDTNFIMFKKPNYFEGFNYIIRLVAKNKPTILFCGYLVENHIKNIEISKKSFEKTLDKIEN